MAYERDTSGSDNMMVLHALEYLIENGMSGGANATYLELIENLQGQPVSETQAAAIACDGDDSWDTGTAVPSNARWLRFRVKGADAYVAFTSTGSAPAQNGVSFPVSGTYQIAVPSGATKVFTKNETAESDATIHPTWLIKA